MIKARFTFNAIFRWSRLFQYFRLNKIAYNSYRLTTDIISKWHFILASLVQWVFSYNLSSTHRSIERKVLLK